MESNRKSRAPRNKLFSRRRRFPKKADGEKGGNAAANGGENKADGEGGENRRPQRRARRYMVGLMDISFPKAISIEILSFFSDLAARAATVGTGPTTRTVTPRARRTTGTMRAAVADVNSEADADVEAQVAAMGEVVVTLDGDEDPEEHQVVEVLVAKVPTVAPTEPLAIP